MSLGRSFAADIVNGMASTAILAVPGGARRPGPVPARPTRRARAARARADRPVRQARLQRGAVRPVPRGARGDRAGRARGQPLSRRRLLRPAAALAEQPRARPRADRGRERRRRDPELPRARDARARGRGRVLLAVVPRVPDQRGQDGRGLGARAARGQQLRPRRAAACVTPRTKIVFVTNPNNPTGGMVGRDALARFLDGLPEHVLPVLDEAYFEYVDDPEYPDGLREHLLEDRRVVVLRTFSKIYGLAGLRVGWGAMPLDVAAALGKVKNAFDVSQPAQDAARASIGETRRSPDAPPRPARAASASSRGSSRSASSRSRRSRTSSPCASATARAVGERTGAPGPDRPPARRLRRPRLGPHQRRPAG